MNLPRFLIPAAFTMLVVTTPLRAAWVRVEQIHAADLSAGSSGVRFGTAVAADVRFGQNKVRALYVGAPNATASYLFTNYPGAGVVYVLTQQNGHWQLSSIITATPPQANAHFGSSVAVQNGIIIVGEPDFDSAGSSNSGRLSYFGDTQWSSPTVAEPNIVNLGTRTVAFDNAHLGASVDVSGAGATIGSDGSYLAGGAPGLASGLGCAYVAHVPDTIYSGGSVQQLGSVCGAAAGDSLGASVAIRSIGGGQINLVAGAPGVAQNGNVASGAAYVYILVNNALTKVGNLHAQNPGLLDTFGTSVAVDSHRVYVGATGREKTGLGRTGSVSLFNPVNPLGYDFDSELFPGTNAHVGDLCGAAIALNGATDQSFAMGCPGSDGVTTDEGAVRVFTSAIGAGGLQWSSVLLSLGNLPHAADDLGRSVAIVTDHVYAGAPLADDAVGLNNGSVEVFAVDALFADGFQ